MLFYKKDVLKTTLFNFFKVIFYSFSFSSSELASVVFRHPFKYGMIGFDHR